MAKYRVEEVKTERGIQFAVVHNGFYRSVVREKDAAIALCNKFNKIRERRLAEAE